MSFPTLSRLAVAERLTNEYGQPLVLLPWLRELLAKVDDPHLFEFIVWLVRQAGKSTGCASLANTELLCVPNSYTMLVASSEAQQQAIFSRKVRKPLERLLDELGLRDAARFTKNGVEIPALNAAIVVLASNEATAPGRTPTKLIVDEARDVETSVFIALAPSIIGAGGKIIIASTAGRPSGWFHDLVQNPTPETWLYQSSENENPHANRGVLDFLRRRLTLVAPSAARRELSNEFTDDADAFLPTALVDAAVDDTLGELPSSDLPAFGFLDLSRKRDLTSLVVIVRDTPRRPEATDHLIVGLVRTWNPRESPTGEVDFAEVREALAALPQRFPGLDEGSVLVDEGAEGGAVLPWARSHPALSLVVKGFIASAATNMQLWSALSARLHARTLSMPRHERLLLELRNLRQESFALGVSFRIVDGSRRLHRDVSLALAGACLSAGDADDGPPLCLVGGSAYREWESRRGMRRPSPPGEDAEPDDEGGDDELSLADQSEDARSSSPSVGSMVQAVVKPIEHLVERGQEVYSAYTTRRRAERAHQAQVAATSDASATKHQTAVERHQREAEREARQQEARNRAAARWLEDQVKRGGGAWFPESSHDDISMRRGWHPNDR